MAAHNDLRDQILLRLREDLMGPSGGEEEVITERPSDRYLTGILYPQLTALGEENDDSLATASKDKDDSSGDDQVAGMRLARPAAAGLSFMVSGEQPQVRFTVTCGMYEQIEDEAPGEKARRNPWRRTAHRIEVTPDALESGRLKLEGNIPPGLELILQVSRKSGGRLVTAAVVNRNKVDQQVSRLASDAKCFYQVELAASPLSGTAIVARPSRQAPVDEDGRSGALLYRHAVEFASGHTCSADWVLGPTPDTATHVRTSWFPEAEVEAVSASGGIELQKLAGSIEGRCFDAQVLADDHTDLVQVLAPFLAAYRKWIEAREAEAKLVPEEHRAQAARHLNSCRACVDRMELGVQALGGDQVCEKAFRLANEAMVKQYAWSQAHGAQLRWRPFQLGFLLLAIASVREPGHADRAIMDMLWFPTGGGKTEAYLGLIAFTLFARRLRYPGKPDEGAGTAAIMRYTLRLLTAQQFQRAAALILACETLRRRAAKEGGLLGAVPFSIGLWVGKEAVANTVADALTALKEQGRNRPDQLSRCPACNARIVWGPGPHASYVRARCENPDCELAGPDLPVWTVDEDVYRQTPSLLIGTIDKFAILPIRPEARALFGLGTSFAPPDLIIQDELHLISGPLGSLAGLYEGAVDLLCTKGGHRPKVIGSTATIRRADAQILALFDRQAQLFPPPGLDAEDSCFAVIDRSRPPRRFSAVTTAGRSAKYILQAVAASIAQSAGALRNTGHEVDGYWTSVHYFNALRELGGAVVLMQDDVPASVSQFAARRGETPRDMREIGELTSRLSQNELKERLDELALTYDKQGALDVVLATNMISVGIDVGRLGLMVVNGQPKTIAEYIQATSRVGRQGSPGLIVSIYNNAKARDRSRYETFRTWHQTLYREVEATSVTPWSSRARDRGLKAIVVTIGRFLVDGLALNPTLGTKGDELMELLRNIADRAARADEEEAAAVESALDAAVVQWHERGALDTYMAHPKSKKPALLVGADEAARMRALRKDVGEVWPVPMSMRNVEPGTPVTIIEKLSATAMED